MDDRAADEQTCTACGRVVDNTTRQIQVHTLGLLDRVAVERLCDRCRRR